MLPIIRERILAVEARHRNLQLIRRRIELRERSDPFSLEDNRFIELFRLNKRLARQLINILRPRLEDRVSRKGITLETKIFCALRFYATGSYQRCIGQDFNCGMSQTVAHRCIRSVTQALAGVAEEYIQLPNTQQERNSLKYEFMQHWGFPGTIGAIDCFHVSILRPNIDEHNFVNRKGYHSLNVQVVCDHKLKIRSLYANFGGSTHDSFIWRVSVAHEYMNVLYQNNESCWLIGDSGYPLQPYLLTPYRDVQNDAQQRYNRAHISARNCVERCIGVLKMRFRCLQKERSARYDPNFMCEIIKACAVLHNLCIEENIPYEEIVDDNDNEIPFQYYPLQNYAYAAEGIQTRHNVVNGYFTY